VLKFVYNFFSTLTATSPIVVIFLIQKQVAIPFLVKFPVLISYCIYILSPVIITWGILFLTKYLSDDEIKGHIKDIEQANHSYLSVYIGYFFVALSIPRFETLYFIFGILFLLTYLSQTVYYNPLFLIWKYQFYYLTTENNVKIFLITRRQMRNPNDIESINVKRINNFTFIECGGKDESSDSES
jgi:hypothetical protein